MKKLFFVITVLISIQMSAQTIVKARLTKLADDSNVKEIEAICASTPDFDFIAKNFDFPPNIADNIIYQNTIVKKSDEPQMANLYNLFDSLGRVRTYFYSGSMVSGIAPQGYLFEYADDTPIILRLTDDADHSTYNIIYSDGRISAIRHYDMEGNLLENLELFYE
ncbi:MAG: hypothetical protein JXR53_02210 [Bacteroidales bacterium]|nr:hypothetical protein [Bacteroidales bacterium]